MRIGIDATPITNRSGTGYYTQKLVEFLGRADGENEYVIFCPTGYRTHLEHAGMFDYPNFQIIEVWNGNQVSQLVWKQIQLPRQVRTLGIEMFHFPAFVASLRIDIPWVVTVHDLCYFLFPETFSRIKLPYYRYFIPRSVRRSDAVISDSDSTRRDILEHFRTEKAVVETIHLGVDPVLFYQISDEARREQVRSKYSLPKNFVLYVGTLEPRKNIPRLIRAFNKGIVCRGRPYDLVIAGRKGWLFDDIFREVNALNLASRVHFPGHIRSDELAILYSMARAFAYPSLYEGFGLPCLESMSCGTPVIASDRSSLPEVVGECALLVDPLSTDSIADALTKICSDDACHERLSEGGVQRASRFSWLSTAIKTVEVYRGVMERVK